MNDKGHFYTSLIKSTIRIVGSIAAVATGSVVTLAIFFGVAELVGIAEEVFDKR